VSVRPAGGDGGATAAAPALVTPAGEGHAEAPPSAALDIPPAAGPSAGEDGSAP
jgi:hypothetical protein